MTEGESEVKKPVPNSGEDFYDRLCALSDEAKSYGHSVLIGLVEHEPMKGMQEIMVSYTGGWVTCIGIAEHARHVINRGRPDPINGSR